MRKLFLSLVLAFGIVSAAHSATGYGLYIGTTEVTSSNQSDVLGDGTVSYNPTTHTLTLQNANLTLSESLSVHPSHGDLIISVKGKNTINVINTDSHAIFTECGLSIVGATKNAQLTLKGNSGIGASTGNNHLNIHIGGGTYPLTLNIDAIRRGIYNDSYGSLGIAKNIVINKNTTVNISATTDGAVDCYGSITLASGIGITQPVGAHISKGRIFDPQNNVVKSAVCIEPVTEYDLWVDGTQVHSGNQSNILCDKSASATYNPTTNTLTLDNAIIISSSSHAIIQNNIAGLKINISRACTLNSESSSLPVILCTANTTITSSDGASLGIFQQAKEFDAVVNDGCKLAIDGGDFGLYVHIIGHSGIHGKNSGAEFSIKNAYLTIDQSVNGAIHGQSSINLNDCAITQPAVAQIYNGAIVDKNNKVVCEEVTIRKVEKYPLYVAGIQVNEVNYKNITGDGKVIYNPSSKTLTLRDGANISCSTKSPIFSGVDGLTLLCEGKATLSYTGTSASEHGLYVTGSTTIRSYLGSLTINSPNAAIYSTECTTTIRAITLTLNGKKYGFRGMPSGEFSSNLEIVRADVNIAATTNGAISNISSLTLTDIEIMEPAKCSFSASKMGLVDASNTIVTSAVMMETVVKYGVYVKGVQVTSKNCSDILGDGKVTYVNYNNTLTLNHVNIVYDGWSMIAAYQDLTINCVGTNTLTTNSDSWSCIMNDVGSVTITGSGTLSLVSNAYSAIEAQGGLTITGGCTVTAQSATFYAISLFGEPLTIDGATLIAEGNGSVPTIQGCSGLTLNNAEISSGHTYDATQQAFLTAEGAVATDKITFRWVQFNAIVYTASEKIYVSDDDFGGVHVTSHTFVDNIGTIWFSDKVTTIGEKAFDGCKGLTSITIPEAVTTIEEEAFYGCKDLTSITIPEAVTTIKEYAFYGCSSLESVTLPASITTIASYAFYDCSNLQKTNYTGTIEDWCKIVFEDKFSNPTYYSHYLYIKDVKITDLVIPEGVKKISSYIFAYNYHTSLTLPASLKEIGEGAFQNCPLMSSITFAEGSQLTTLGEYAFYGCKSLTSIDLPESVITIDYMAFCDCSGLTSVTMGNSVTTLGSYAFCGCSSLTSIDIPESVTTIKGYTFNQCSSLSSVTMGNSVTTLKYGAFWGCTSLTSIDIPQSVTTIELRTFEDCYALKDVTVHWETPEQLPFLEDEEIFADIAKQDDGNVGPLYATLHVPSGTKAIYEVADVWKEFGTIEDAPSAIEAVTSSSNKVRKFVCDGQIFIRKGDKVSNLLGNSIK